MQDTIQTTKDVSSVEDLAHEAMAKAYLMDLGLDWEILKGKKVLDIGAGLAGFAQVAMRRGIQGYSLDAHPEWWSEEGTPPSNVPFVAGDGKQLPFMDESFDVIVARAAVHSIVEVQKDLVAVLSEARRVLKPGGEFRFGPGSININPLREEEWDRWFKLLEKVRNNEEITPEEDAWGEKVWPAYKLHLERIEELSRLTTEERINYLEETSLRDLQELEPSITAHPIDRELNWKGKIEQVPSVYFLMKKPFPKT